MIGIDVQKVNLRTLNQNENKFMNTRITLKIVLIFPIFGISKIVFWINIFMRLQFVTAIDIEFTKNSVKLYIPRCLYHDQLKLRPYFLP